MGTKVVGLASTSTFKFVWKIDNFSKLYLENKVFHYSDVFSAGGAKWKVMLYPKGDGKVFDHLSIYLCCADSNKYPVDAKYRFTITSQTNTFVTSDNGKFGEGKFNNANDGWGFSKFVTLRRLHNSGYILADTLKIYIEITIQNAADTDKPVKEEQHT
ncbi:hypothetical protein MKX03_027971 [Papaver bracteatum]|nr:hypothetical protein MKX03_027971 [Papaver bracteatum]